MTHDPPSRPTCPNADCRSRRITDAPAESRMDRQCEDCGRTFLDNRTTLEPPRNPTEDETP